MRATQDRTPQTPWQPLVDISNDVVAIDDLRVSFKRTIRVPDNTKVSNLPPDMGNFPLRYVSDCAETLPAPMAAKGGMFLPMYQREAMWLNFDSVLPYAIKIYVGGINAISGEPAIKTSEDGTADSSTTKTKENLQDYVVTPKQPWLDGIATSPGQVRQFVAMPLGKGYTVERQLTGIEAAGGIQIEITPAKPEIILIVIKEDHCQPYELRVLNTETLSQVAKKLEVGPEDYIRVDGKVFKKDVLFGNTFVKEGSMFRITRRAGKSVGFDSRARHFRVRVTDARNHNQQIIDVSPDDTINDLKFLLHPDSAYIARFTKLRLVGEGEETSHPLDGRMKVLEAIKLSTAGDCLVQEYPAAGTDTLAFIVKTLTGKKILINCSATDAVREVKTIIAHKEGIPTDQQRLIFDGEDLEDDCYLDECGVISEAVMYMVLRLRGGYDGPPLRHVPAGLEMGIAAGGLIKQTIVADPGKFKFDASGTIVFNVQVLNSEHFHSVTGQTPPASPIDAATYAAYGYPFYDIYEEHSPVAGNFGGVKSVKQLEGKEDVEVKPVAKHLGALENIDRKSRLHTQFFNAVGPYTTFRSTQEMKLAIHSSQP